MVRGMRFLVEDWVFYTVILITAACCGLRIPIGHETRGPIRASPGWRKTSRPPHLRLVGVWGKHALARLDMIGLPLLSLAGAALVSIAFVQGELRDAPGALDMATNEPEMVRVISALHWALVIIYISTSGLVSWVAALMLRPVATSWADQLRHRRISQVTEATRKTKFVEAGTIVAWVAAIIASVAALAVILLTPVLAYGLFSVLGLPAEPATN